MIADASQRFLSGLKGVTRSGKTDVHYLKIEKAAKNNTWSCFSSALYPVSIFQIQRFRDF